MDRRNEFALKFGKILEDGYRHLDTPTSPPANLQEDVILATIHRNASVRRGRRVAIGFLAAAAASAALFLIMNRPAPMTIILDGTEYLTEEGLLIRTDTQQVRTLKFSDNSHLKVAPLSESRLVEASNERVVVDLYKGKLNAYVAPNRDNRWTVRAGPYKVDVVGTRFHVNWTPNSNELLVSVEKGRVAVRGPGIDASGIFLSAGSVLQAKEKSRTISVGPATEAFSEMNNVQEKPREDRANIDQSNHTTNAEYSESALVDGQAGVPHKLISRGSMADENKWKRLAQSKKYAAAMSAAREIGISKISTVTSAKDLWLLATTARYAGEIDNATILFTAHRQRFPGNIKSKTAAYMLALIALEQQRNQTAALKWLTTYLLEAPNGALHEEALGRLMKLANKMGRHSDAQKHAANYIRQYPKGLFWAQAQSILHQ